MGKECELSTKAVIGRIKNKRDIWLNRDERLQQDSIYFRLSQRERKALHLVEIENLGIMSCAVEEGDKSGLRNF